MIKEKKSYWIIWLCFALGLAIIVFSIIDKTYISLILVPLAFLWGSICFKWAKRINKNRGLAFMIGFLFSLVGILFYYIFVYEEEYRFLKKSEDNKKEKEG